MIISKIRSNANKKTIDFFDLMAKDYDRAENFQEPKRCYEETLKEVKKYKSDICVLDVGCGTGTMLRKICDECSKVIVAEGVDISGAMVEQAQKLSEGYPINFWEGALEDIDLKKEKYNVLLCMHSFHHYQKPLKMLKIMRESLCDKGRLIIVENRKEKRLQVNYNLMKNDFPNGDLWMYSKYELTFLTKLAGFKRIGYKKCGMQSFMLVCHKN